jgi:hypothetical protein
MTFRVLDRFRIWPPWRKDLVVVAATAIVVFALSASADLLNAIIGWIYKHETWQLDEMFTVFIFLAGAMSLYAFRRYRELVVEIARRKQVEAANARLVPALERAREDAASLRKIVPVCPSCKRIRDTKGNWFELETFLEVHYMGRVNEGLCPGCARELYGHTPAPSTPEEVQ